MSVFDLDTDGQKLLTEEAASNVTRIDQTPAGFFDNTGTAVGTGIMRGGARVGQFIGMASAVIPMVIDAVSGDDNFSGESLTDRYFRAMDDTVNNAVDYWTPNAAETGTAGRVLGGLSEIALPLMAGGGNPLLMIGSQEMGTSTDLVRQGVTPGAAVSVGIVQGASTALGFKMPYLGKTLASRMASGAAGNLLTNAGGAAVQQQILERTGNTEAAQQFDPWNLEARAVDVLTGIAFGGLAHLQMAPADRAAVAAANNAKHFQADTAPGIPVDEVAAVRHQQALEQAIEASLKGEKVIAPDAVTQADFVPRAAPEMVVPDELKALDTARLMYHGTPHSFEKFDLSKIGTGEGMQAYGWGIYFADNEKTAGAYRTATSAKHDVKITGKFDSDFWEKFDVPAQDVRSTAVQLIQQEAFNPGYIKSMVDNDSYIGNVAKNIISGGIEAPKGHLYTLEIPSESVSRMLDWDKPLSEQADFVKKALSPFYSQNMTGEAIYKEWANEGLMKNGKGANHGKYASEIAQLFDIPGLRYLDAGSRTSGDGTHNTVIWDQSLLDRLSANEGNAPKAKAPDASQAPVDPIVQAARQITTDLTLPTGEIDADGIAKTVSARQLLDQTDLEVKQAQNDALGFEAAVNCFLSKGAQ